VTGPTRTNPAPNSTAVVALLAATIVAALAGCGSSQPKSAARPADFKKALTGAPRPIARLYGQPARLLGGGPDAFRRQLAALRGHPVVVNKWASWCGPCRFEFPFFQRQALAHGKEIAFVGVDGEDSRDGARRFLARFPVPYPSFSDPHSEIAKVFHGDRAFPTTAYFDRKGGVEYVKQGGYASNEALATDIARYAR